LGTDSNTFAAQKRLFCIFKQFIDRSAKTKRSCPTHTKRVEPSIWELDGIHNGLHHEHVRNIEEITKGDPGTSQVLKLLFHP
jgi:hypothetical protein